jgi:hypothetical protein
MTSHRHFVVRHEWTHSPRSFFATLKSVYDTIWIWHTPLVPQQDRRYAGVAADPSRGKQIHLWEVGGLRAVWIRYPVTR